MKNAPLVAIFVLLFTRLIAAQHTFVADAYQVDTWCTTPGTYDDTCFTNAIADITANGPIGAGGFHYGEILVPARHFVFQHTVTIPYGTDIGIVGVDKDSLFGSMITSGVANLTLFQDYADDFDMRHLIIFGNYPGVTGIVLGSDTQISYDTRLTDIWWQNLTAAIRLHNVLGLDISDDTFDTDVAYGIFSDYSAGDLRGSGVNGNNLEIYGQIHTNLHPRKPL